MRVSVDEDPLDEEFGERSQDGELAQPPPFVGEIAAHRVVEVTALVVEPVVVEYPAEAQTVGRVVFVAENEAADAPFAKQGKRAKKEKRHRPQADRVLVGTDTGEVGPDKGHVPQHPREDPVGVHPYSRRPRDVTLEIAVRVESGEPVTARFVPEYRMDFVSDLVQ